MFANSDGPLEVAMTYRPGVGGSAERCLRPESVREMAQRVQKWSVQQEVCRSCQNLPAARISAGWPLCGRCLAQKQTRNGWRAEPEGLKPTVVQRAEDVDASSKDLRGYAIRFNERSVDLGGFFEFIRPSAADRLETEKPDLRAFWNHDSSETIGRVSAGTMLAVKRTRGVWVDVQPPRWAARYVESVERRDIQGQSFGFYVLSDDWWLEEGFPHREVLDMRTIETSFVSFPAYPTTTATVRNAGERSEWQRERETAERLRLVR